MGDLDKAAGVIEEEWRPVVGMEGTYEVSSYGRVRSLDRHLVNRPGSPFWRGRMMTPRKNSFGYWVVTLCDGNGKRATARVHRLVAAAFIPNPEQKPQVNHIDNDPANARADNLEWVTPLENVAHTISQGRQNNGQLGKRSHSAKLTEAQVRAVWSRLKRGERHAPIAADFGVTVKTIENVKSGRSYRYV